MHLARDGLMHLEYEIQLQQLRILQTQLQESAAAQCAVPKHALAVAAVAAPYAVPIHMHPAPGMAPTHVLAVPTGPSYSPTNTSPSFPPGITVPSYITTSQGYDTTSQGYDTSSPSYSPSFPPGTVPSYDTSSPSFSPSSPNFLPTSASYDPNSPIYLQTMPSSSRVTSCTRTSHPHEPPSCSPGYAFAKLSRYAAEKAADEDERLSPLRQPFVQREVPRLRAPRGGARRFGQLRALRQPHPGRRAPANQGRGSGETGALHRAGRHGLPGGRRPARAADLHRRRQEVHPPPASPLPGHRQGTEVRPCCVPTP